MGRVRSARSLLVAMKELATEAGIYDSMFLSFGTLLGAIRPTLRDKNRTRWYARGLMQHDHDMDVGIIGATDEQKEKYYQLCVEHGLMSHWDHPGGRIERRKDNNGIMWFSVKQTGNGIRCCQWFFWPWNGFYWHSKGAKWTAPNKFNPLKYKRKADAEAMALGFPMRLMSDLAEIDFEGVQFNIPSSPGGLLDRWYPGWAVPDKGSSRKTTVLVINQWKDEKTWKMAVN